MKIPKPERFIPDDTALSKDMVLELREGFIEKFRVEPHKPISFELSEKHEREMKQWLSQDPVSGEYQQTLFGGKVILGKARTRMFV